jgi:hypothetical protein
VYGREHFLTCLVAEELAQQLERWLQTAYAVTMCHQELMAINLLDRVAVNDLNAKLGGEVVVNPDVVVADKPDYAYATVGKLGELAEEAHEATRHDIAVFVPVIEYVAQQKDCVGFLLD